MTTSRSCCFIQYKIKHYYQGNKEKSDLSILGKPGSWEISSGFCLRCLVRAVFTWLSKGIGFGFGFGFTTPFGWLVYLLWFWFYNSQVKTALSMSKIRKRVFKRATAVSTAIRITWNNYIENYTQTAVINIVKFRIFIYTWRSVLVVQITFDHFWKCILTSIRKNAKAQNVYQRCLCFIFD